MRFTYVKGCRQVFSVVSEQQWNGINVEVVISSNNCTNDDMEVIGKIANRTEVSYLGINYGKFQMANKVEGYLTVYIDPKYLTDKPYGTEMGSCLY